MFLRYFDRHALPSVDASRYRPMLLTRFYGKCRKDPKTLIVDVRDEVNSFLTTSSDGSNTDSVLVPTKIPVPCYLPLTLAYAAVCLMHTNYSW